MSIINVEEAKRLGRPIGKVANDKIETFIEEVEQTIIRKVLGDSLFLMLSSPYELEEKYVTLLEGGQYADKCGNVKILTGLKKAIAYFVYAQNVRSGDIESTRYGMVIKDGDYSTNISSRERDTLANSSTAIAQSYLNECIEYCRHAGIPVGSGKGNSHITSGCIIRKVKK